MPLTLTEIVTALRAGEGRRPGLLAVPPALIALASRGLGRAEEWQRLGGALVADPAKLMQVGWKPAADTRAALAALARATSPRNAN
jgi:UDP-glucose 4-epimerase